jgi:hypothetical protein
MLQDSSEDYQDLWEFLDRRLEDLTTIGKFARNVCTGYNSTGRKTKLSVL